MSVSSKQFELYLVDPQPDLCDAWTIAFKELPGINIFRVLWLVMLFQACAGSLYPQTDNLERKLIDTVGSVNLSLPQIEGYFLGLPSVKSSDYPVHFRFSLSGQVVDLYRLNDNTVYGTLTNYTLEYKEKKTKRNEVKESIANQYVMERCSLNSISVSKLVEKIMAESVYKWPTDSLIIGWNKYFIHCDNITIQCKVNGNYSLLRYYCPWGQSDTLVTKMQIVNLYDYLKAEFRLDSLYNNFQSNLPGGKVYSMDGYRMVYNLTPRESELWIKSQPEREYLQSVKDSIDRYIEVELQKRKTDLVCLNLFAEYDLLFSKKGNLKVVTVREKSKYTFSEFLESLAERRKQKRDLVKVRSILKGINLISFTSGIEVHRHLSIYSDDIILSDNTVY